MTFSQSLSLRTSTETSRSCFCLMDAKLKSHLRFEINKKITRNVLNNNKRSKQREEEKRQQEERDLEREVQKLKEHQTDIELQLQEEAKKEERIRRAMERELHRVEEATQLREDLRRQEDELDQQFEQQVEELKKREQGGEVFLSRRVARRQLAESIYQREEGLIAGNEQAKVSLRNMMTDRHQRSIAALDDARKTAAEQKSVVTAMEKGRMMRLCGITRADQAYQAGFINIPPPPPTLNLLEEM